MVALVQDSFIPDVKVNTNPSVRSRRRLRRMTVSAWRLDHSLPARRIPNVELRIDKLAEDGLDAVCDLPLLIGEHLTIVFPATGYALGWDTSGQVTECHPTDGGYRIKIDFETLPAA